MNLISFLTANTEAIEEDYRAVSLERGYRPGDLSAMRDILGESRDNNVSLTASILVKLGSSLEAVSSNFTIRRQTIRAILAGGVTKEIRITLASILSVEHDSDSLVEELERFIKVYGPKRFRIRIYLLKSDLSRLVAPGMDSFSVHPWLSIGHLRYSIAEDPKGFLVSIWSGSFPIFVLPRLRKSVTCKFCVFSNPRDDPPQVDTSAFRIFSNFATRMLKMDVPPKYLLSMSLTPTDTHSRRFVSQLTNLVLPPQSSKNLFAESQFHDFKRGVPGEVARIVAGFANALGGVLLIGLDSDGMVFERNPAKDPDQVAGSLTEVLPLPNYQIIEGEIEGKYVFALIIHPATGNLVYKLRNGNRPIRWQQTTRIFADDNEVLATRRLIRSQFELV